MEKENLRVNYSGSGINSLRVISVLNLIISIGGAVVLFMYSMNIADSTSGQLIIYSIILLVSGITLSVILRAVAVIAENSLIQKAKLLQEFKIIEDNTI